MTDLGEGGGIVVEMMGPYAGQGDTSAAKLVDITLPAAQWKGASSPFSMLISVEGISLRSRVDLFPSIDILEKLRLTGTGLCAENNDGAITLYALGGKPQEDITVQAAITEVKM